MNNNLKNLSKIECINVHGGDCSNCNDSFWARLGNSIGEWINSEIEAGNNMTWTPRYRR